MERFGAWFALQDGKFKPPIPVHKNWVNMLLLKWTVAKSSLFLFQESVEVAQGAQPPQQQAVSYLGWQGRAILPFYHDCTLVFA